MVRLLRFSEKSRKELGVKKSRKLLQESGYTTEEIKPIMEIVDGHDTRKEFLSPSDGIMRDADKLARFSKDGFWSEMVQKRGMTKEDKYKALLITFILPTLLESLDRSWRNASQRVFEIRPFNEEERAYESGSLA
jgi:hypothetical protein